MPERSTRPMQRTSVPWQWGQVSGGGARGGTPNFERRTSNVERTERALGLFIGLGAACVDAACLRSSIPPFRFEGSTSVLHSLRFSLARFPPGAYSCAMLKAVASNSAFLGEYGHRPKAFRLDKELRNKTRLQ